MAIEETDSNQGGYDDSSLYQASEVMCMLSSLLSEIQAFAYSPSFSRFTRGLGGEQGSLTRREVELLQRYEASAGACWKDLVEPGVSYTRQQLNAKNSCLYVHHCS